MTVIETGPYGIFQPNTMILRGTVPDPNQTTPIGLNGGRLAEAIDALINTCVYLKRFNDQWELQKKDADEDADLF